MITRKDKGSYRVQFDSLPEMQRFIDATPRTWQYSESERCKADLTWDLSAGMVGALKLARDGWHAGANKLAEGLQRLPALDAMPAWQHDVAGHMVDVDRWIEGEPECMWTLSDNADNNRKPVITLAIGIAANCGTNAQCMANYGLAVAWYVDELEAQGQSVEVIASIADEVHSTRVGISWLVKEAGQALNLEALAFSIAHPAAWRRLGFAVLERLPIRSQSNYGHSKDSKLSDLIDPSAGTIVLNGIMRANQVAATPAAAMEHVGKQIAASMTNMEAATVGISEGF